MAEWLRRLTRNQMGSSRVGSNPTRSDSLNFYDTQGSSAQRAEFKLNDIYLKGSLYVLTNAQSILAKHQCVPHGLVARISGFHPGGPGSIPGAGGNCLFAHFIKRV